MSDIYCYPGTNVLVNKFNIRDNKKLSDLELIHWRINRKKLLAGLPKNPTINLELWQRIHRETFGSVYSWAGEIRSVMIAKGNALHAVPGVIVPYAEHLLGQLKDDKYLKGLAKEDFLQKASYYLEELNAIHPFREGNTRTLKLFFSLLSHNVGYDIDWTKIDSKDYQKAEYDSFSPGKKNPPPFYPLLEKAVEPIKTKFKRSFKL